MDDRLTRLAASDLAIIGLACRLPGADTAASLWTLLTESRSAIKDKPHGRWPVERGLHPRRTEPGFAYTFAGGYLDDPFGFDPVAFGISPREAQQIDPQQRLLLELVWEALEDAGIPASSPALGRVGVYVGASNVDYQMAASGDPAAIESHFMTGNSLSIISNRISYIYDWQGPSFTVDSACSSSFVALAQAASALEAGEVDTAIVGGVNLLLSGAPFIGFSRASMLSPTGRCRPFSAAADGYVRSEGGVVIVLRRSADAKASGQRIRSHVLGAIVNSDGRTSGISLPSAGGQARLIADTCGAVGIDAQDLAFVEAHGTGTPVGDPVEAQAIGSALGRGRATALPVGSVKSNIGHLESASGLAGLVKSVLALEHGLYPRTLYLDELNPHIDFKALNLAPTHEHTPLDLARTPFASICNYGFGGTNAHVVLRAAEPAAPVASDAAPARLLALSARSQDALRALAGAYADRIEAGDATPADIAAAARYQRDGFDLRLALPVEDAGTMAAALRRFGEGAGEEAGIASGKGTQQQGKVAFIYSGNGAQWVGMGRTAYARNEAFRAAFDEIDALFAAEGGWSLIEALGAADLEERIGRTSIAQPLIFAIEVALTRALAAEGLVPDMVLGHSVGEVAAAAASGALSLADAIHLIHHRSLRQEAVAGAGRMLALGAGEAQVRALLESLAEPDLDIAAVNGPRSVTLSGSAEAIGRAERAARLQRIATVPIGVEYPFHSRILDPVEAPIRADLSGLRPGPASIDFISTVTGASLPGPALDAGYWWRNIREPVRFSDAVAEAAARGASHFVELGPRPILLAATGETLREAGLAGECIASLAERDDRDPGDPVRATAARAFVRGARLDEARVFGPVPAGRLSLPPYPFQRQRLVLPRTSEALVFYGGPFGAPPAHPLLGQRVSQNIAEWRSFIDAEVVPYLADHAVESEVVVPGAALAEMMLAAGRETFGDGPLELRDFDILRPLTLADGTMREMSIRIDEVTRSCEIRARHRLSGAEFLLHAIGRIGPCAGTASPFARPGPAGLRHVEAAEVYAAAERCGLRYGPAFRKVLEVEREDGCAVARLAVRPVGAAERYVIDPTSFDAVLHPLFVDAEHVEGERRAHLPVRIGALRVFQPGATVVEGILWRRRQNRFTACVDIVLLAADGSVVAELDGLILREVVLSRHDEAARRFRPALEPLANGAPAVPDPAALADFAADPTDAVLLLRGFVRSLAYETAARIGAGVALSLPALVAAGRIGAGGEAQWARLMGYLETLDLADADGADGWTLREAALPASGDVFRTLVARCPGANAEIRLAAHLKASLAAALETGKPLAPPPVIAELFEEDGLLYRAGQAALHRAIARQIEAAAPARAHIVAVRPWTAGLIRVLLPFLRDDAIRVTLAGGDASAFARMASRPGGEGLSFLDTGTAGARPAAPVDLVIGLAGGPLFGGSAAEARAVAAIGAGAPVLCACPAEDAAFDLLLGRGADSGTAPLGAEALQALFADSGYGTITRTALPDGLSSLVGGVLPPAAAIEPPRPLVIGAPSAEAFCRALAGGGTVLDRQDPLPDLTDGAATEVVFAAAFDPDLPARAALSQCLLDLKRLMGWASERAGTRLWLATARGRPVPGSPVDPLATAVTAFGRVLMNEYPGVDLRLVDVDAFDSPAAARLLRLIGDGGPETELAAAADRTFAVRVRRGLPRQNGPADDAHRTRLHVPQQGALGSMDWLREARKAPAAGEIEIEVAATGLNFRDVMLALGALDDDILGPGLTGASLGFECAGTVVRVGEGVTGVGVGDRVMGFAPDAFSTHVTVPAWYAFPVPEGLSAEAAAAIPVAFATAWYGLVECARLKAGERVLIHGAAGGVGLAAVNIALSRGAHVIATAGTASKTALLRELGVEAVYNSRDLGFARQIAQAHGAVDVVLNSLAGEAMDASLRLVKPFGRFVELGKRDFLSNTSIGLRPFARNISYFGVDLDQLLAHDPAGAQRMMGEIGAAFARGELQPLPYRAMDGESAEEAFRQMQGARHMGKLVVRPQRSGRIAPAAPGDLVLREGIHLVVGGTGGFGLETALWLAARTRGTVVVASRSGVGEAAAARIAAAVAAGASIVPAQVDARNADALAALVDELVAAHGPLRSIVHTAMVLEDGIVANLTAESLDAVLAPKVDGVLALDRITAAHPVDHFVVYSSASAMIGSPGQGAYVAANAFLEGVVLDRRRRGLAGLAVGWGAISDAGVIARDDSLGQRLTRTTGVAGITSAEALGFLGQLLAQGPASEPVAVYAQVSASAIAAQLAVLKTPTFPQLFAGSGEGGGEGENLLVRLAEASDEEARELLGDVLAKQIAGILRLPLEAVDKTAPLSDLGMDSLMALELRMTLEKDFGLELPLLGIGGGRTLGALVDVALASLRREAAPAEADAPAAAAAPPVDPRFLELHGVSLKPEESAALASTMESQRRQAAGGHA